MKVKKAIFAIVTAVFLAFTLAFSGLGSLSRLSTPTINLKSDNNSTIESPGLSFVSVPLAAGDSVIGVERVTATVTPAGTPIEWSLSWENSGDGRTMSDYLTIKTVSSNSIDLTCLQRFSGTAILRCAFVHDPSIYDTVSVTAVPSTTPSGDLSSSVVLLIAVDHTGSTTYEDEVNQVLAEMQFVAADASVMYSDANSISDDIEETVSGGAADVILIYDYDDTLLNALDRDALNPAVDSAIPVFIANTTYGNPQADVLASSVSGFVYGQSIYDGLINISYSGSLFGDFGSDQILLLQDASIGADSAMVSAIQTECDTNGGSYELVEFNAEDYLSGSSSFAEDYYDYLSGSYTVFGVWNSTFLETLMNAINETGGMSLDDCYFFIWDTDPNTDYGSILPNGNYFAFETVFNVTSISGYMDERMSGADAYEAFCKEMVRI